MKPNQACLLLAASLLPLSTLWLRAANPTPAPAPAPATTTATEPATAAEAAQRVAANRKQLLASASQAVSDGQRLLGSGQYDQAADRFQFALDALTDGGISANLYNRAEAGLAAAKAGQAEQLAKDDKFAQAATLLEQAISLQPNNPVYTVDIEDLKKQQLAYEEQVRDPEGTVNNPAVTEDFKAEVATVQKLLFQGDAYFRTGQFDKAGETYSKILILDPYNKAAREKMAHIEHYKERAAEFRHGEYEQEQMVKVNEGWNESISPDIVTPPVKLGDDSGFSGRAIISRKLSSIIIDKVDFDKLDIDTVIQFLQQKSKELDPEHVGINFVLRLTSEASPTPEAGAAGAVAPTGAAPGAPAADATPAHTIHREVSINLQNVPLKDVLGYIIQQTNLQFTIEDYAVYLRPSIDEGETLTVRTYLVPPNFFPNSSLRVTIAPTTDNAASTVENLTNNVQQALTDKGIRFPAGATATFLPGSSKLVVRDTPEQLDLIANLIDQLSKETPQVQIEAKLAEFNQDAIKALTFNYSAVATVPSALTQSPFTSFGAVTSLRNSDNGLTADSIDALVNSNPGATTNGVSPITGGPVQNNASNTLTVGAVLDGVGMVAVINAINNMQGVSLLSAPSVTTQNGLKANIDIVREFPYPTSFEKPKLSTNNNLAYSAGPSANLPLQLAIPPTPREFVTQDVGVSLEVKPTTYPDQRIDLNITKNQVMDFDGFIDYGVPIVVRLSEDAPPRQDEGQILTEGVINQPVFNLRSIVTNLQVLDGQTAVLGGLIREDTQEINDKVPVLGDLPLVGRLFQSKVSERTKKTLLEFITARLIRSNGKPQYIKTFDAEPEEEKLPEPDQQIGPAGVTLPPLPDNGTPNS